MEKGIDKTEVKGEVVDKTVINEFQETVYSKFILNNFTKEFYNKKIPNIDENNVFDIAREGLECNNANSDFDFSFLDLSKIKYSVFLKALNPESKVESIIFASNPNINETILNDFVTAFCQVKVLKNLFLYNTNLKDSQLANPICNALEKDSIEFLLLSNDELNDSGLKQIAGKLIKCKKLQRLSLTSLNLGADSLNHLANCINSCQSLKILEIAKSNFSVVRTNDFNVNKEITNPEINFLKSLRNSVTLEHLSMIACKLGKEAAYITEAISLNDKSALKILNLSENDIDPDIFNLILESLKKAKMQYLILNNNKISDLGMFHLYDYLENTYPSNINGNKFSERVQFFGLEQNEITDKGAQILINAIDNGFFYLKLLNLKFNSISSKNIEKLADSIVNFSIFNENEMNKGNYGIDKIFDFLNISQFGLDVRRNGNMSDEDYKKFYASKIKKEYNRFFKINDQE